MEDGEGARNCGGLFSPRTCRLSGNFFLGAALVRIHIGFALMLLYAPLDLRLGDRQNSVYQPSEPVEIWGRSRLRFHANMIAQRDLAYLQKSGMGFFCTNASRTIFICPGSSSISFG